MENEMLYYNRQDLEGMERFYRTTFVNCLSGPKPAHLLGSQSPAGQFNLSLVSNVLHVGANPAWLGVLFRPHSVPRHSLENLKASGHFSLNWVGQEFYQAAHQCAARYDQGISEFEAVGLEPWSHSEFQAPYVAASPVKLGLAYQEEHALGNGTLLVVGSLEEIWIKPGLVAGDGYLDLEKAEGTSVLGLDAYHRLSQIGRMEYAKPDLPPRKKD